MLDQTFNRLQKLVSQLELLKEKLSQKDINQKLLRSLSPKWNTHVVVWRNKADLDTMSMDDLYNNLKEGSLLLMEMRLLVLINPIWSATIATRHDILLGSAELQEIKTTSTRKAQEGVCMWKQLILQLWCHAIVLVHMTRVIRQRKDQIMHSWLSHLQVLTQRRNVGIKRLLNVVEVTATDMEDTIAGYDYHC
uniref:Ribonuclease H-like domain-containing protein n=1 Tax=Tanacetum cinerariifolium TaxID=118510 RepID=A0A6L2K3P9_TANCI|nr:ribonuclease H-like domain-containing protein [Tanacetum cinerariifolium]